MVIKSHYYILILLMLLCCVDVMASENAVITPQIQFGHTGNKRAEFNRPQAVAISANRIYVADTLNHRVQVLDLTGRALQVWGQFGAQPGQFNRPAGIAIDAAGLIYVSDSGNNRIQIFNRMGRFIGALGNDDRAGQSLNRPQGLVIHADKIYVADRGNHRIAVFNQKGELTLSFGSYGAQANQFNAPSAIAIDKSGAIYISDTNNHRIAKHNAQGEYLKSWGGYGTFSGLFAAPSAIAYHNNRLFIADRNNHRIQVFDLDGNYLYQWGEHPSNGQQGNGRLHEPAAIAINNRLVIVGEVAESRFQIFPINALKTITETKSTPPNNRPLRHPDRITLENNYLAISLIDTHEVMLFDLVGQNGEPKFIGQVGGYGRKFGQLINPAGLAIDSKRGMLYVSDSANHRIQIYEIGVLINGGSAGSAFARAFGQSGNRPMEFNSPAGLAIDSDGNLYVCDPGNSRIQVFSPAHKFLREWRVAALNPQSIFIAANSKKIYLCDHSANSVLVYDLNGQLLTTIKIGMEQQPLDIGDLIVTATGFIYLSDIGNNRIIKIDQDGRSVLAWGKPGDKAGEFFNPLGLTQTTSGEIIVTDSNNHRLQIFSLFGKLIKVITWPELKIRR